MSVFEHLATADRLALRDHVLAKGAPIPLECGLVVAGAWVVGYVVGEAPPGAHGSVPVHLTLDDSSYAAGSVTPRMGPGGVRG